MTEGKVKDAHFTTDNLLQLDLKDGQTYSDGESVKDASKVETEFIDARAGQMLKLVEDNVDGVQNDTVETPSVWSSLLFSLLPLVLLVGLFWFILSQPVAAAPRSCSSASPRPSSPARTPPR